MGREILFSKDGVHLYATDVEEGGGTVLTLALNRHGEKNVINPAHTSAIVSALDVADAHPRLRDTNDKAMIVTGLALDDGASSSDPRPPPPKFFCNGLDLDWMMKNGDSVPSMIESFCSGVLARMLVLPYPTVAALNGHAIGAGLFIALACDYRVMRTARGFVQWPEARLGMRLSKGFAELSKAKVVGGGVGGGAADRDVLREGILTARRYGSRDALEAGLIDGECPVEELYGRAFELARGKLPESGLGLDYFDPKAYSQMKVEMYTDAYRALRFGKVEDVPMSRI